MDTEEAQNRHVSGMGSSLLDKVLHYPPGILKMLATTFLAYSVFEEASNRLMATVQIRERSLPYLVLTQASSIEYRSVVRAAAEGLGDAAFHLVSARSAALSVECLAEGVITRQARSLGGEGIQECTYQLELSYRCRRRLCNCRRIHLTKRKRRTRQPT